MFELLYVRMTALMRRVFYRLISLFYLITNLHVSVEVTIILEDKAVICVSEMMDNGWYEMVLSIFLYPRSLSHKLSL